MIRSVVFFGLLVTLVTTLKNSSFHKSKKVSGNHHRIVGGSPAALGQFPHQVSLREGENDHFCGGFLINSRWIGSAGHCIHNRLPVGILAVVGTIHAIEGGISYTIVQCIPHPEYVFDTNFHDISLLKTEIDVKENNNVRRIPLSPPFAGVGIATVSGFGDISQNGQRAVIMQFANVDVIDNKSCGEKLFGLNKNKFYDHTLCTVTPNGKGSCVGKLRIANDSLSRN